MNTHLPDLIDTFASLRVVVIGEAILDSYLEGSAGRICREAPVPIVDVEARKDAPGGAANTAANVRSLGAQVAFLSVVGDDYEADLLRYALDARGVPTDHVLTQVGRRTLAKHRVVAESQMIVRFDHGSTDPIDVGAEDRLLERLSDLFSSSDALIVSDYGYGILTPRVIQTLTELQARSPHILVVDSKRLTAYRHTGVTLVKPNFQEAIQLLGLAGREADPSQERAEWMAAYGDRILYLTGSQMAAVTLDTEGALVFERNHPPYRTYAQPRPHSRAAGAGDTFISTVTLSLAAGAHTPAAAELASAAAAIVVAKEGTACCSGDELREYVSAGGKYMMDLERFAIRLDQYRREGRRIVFTNGCFDILHRGHITYLSRAKALGDVLIVGVNSDDGVRRLKGPARPINTLEDRIQVLEALSCVDHLIAFDEDTPSELIRVIRPDIFVKGGDYTRETLPEVALVESLGGQVRILPYLPDRSTTGIIERIRTAYETPVRAQEPARGNGQGSKHDGRGLSRSDRHGRDASQESALR